MLVRIAAALCALTLAPLVAEAQWKTAVLPVVGATSEADDQLGLSVLRTRRADDSLQTRPSSFIAHAVSLTDGQRQVFVGFDRWTAGNQRRLQVAAFAMRAPIPGQRFPSYNTKNVSVPSEHSALLVGVTSSRKSSPTSWRYVGFGLAGSGASDSVFIPPCDTIRCPPPRGVCDCIGFSRVFSSYQVAQGSVGWVRDTRDNIFAATRGRVIDASFSFGYRWDVGSFGQGGGLKGLRIDWREYLSLAEAGTLAARVVLSDAIGFSPLGAQNQHSVNDGQAFEPDFLETALTSRFEWRSSPTLISNRVGLVAFADNRVLFNNGSANFVGGGLRYRLDPSTRSSIRIDFFSGPSRLKGLYVGFNEAF